MRPAVRTAEAGASAWTTNLPSENWGPILATAGDVLFSGGTNDRMFRAFEIGRASCRERV